MPTQNRCHKIDSEAVSCEDFFSRIIWVGGVKKFLGGKKLSYEELFPKNLLAKNLLRKKKLQYSQPRIFLAQKIPGDKRKFYEEILRGIFWMTI